MAVVGLEHVNLRTVDPARTIAFFEDVLGMTATPTPGASSMEHSAWIVDSRGAAIVHIGSADAHYATDAMMPFTPMRGGGSVHHVALSCEGIEPMRERLIALGIAYVENEVPQAGLSQIFVSEPDGVLFELNFRRA